MVDSQQVNWKRIWVKRAIYLALAIGVFVALPMLLLVIANLTGVINFSEIYGPLVWFNELSAPAFMIAFFTILIVIGVILFLILKMFETSEGGW